MYESKGNKKLSSQQIARHVSHWTQNYCCRSEKLHIFPYSAGLPRRRDLSSLRAESQLWPGRFGELLAKTQTYPVMYTFFIYCCTTWSKSTNVTDGRTDGRHARSI